MTNISFAMPPQLLGLRYLWRGGGGAVRGDTGEAIHTGKPICTSSLNSLRMFVCLCLLGFLRPTCCAIGLRLVHNPRTCAFNFVGDCCSRLCSCDWQTNCHGHQHRRLPCFRSWKTSMPRHCVCACCAIRLVHHMKCVFPSTGSHVNVGVVTPGVAIHTHSVVGNLSPRFGAPWHTHT